MFKGVFEHTAADLTNKQKQQQFLANKNICGPRPPFYPHLAYLVISYCFQQ
jgi:hypothetical protein